MKYLFKISIILIFLITSLPLFVFSDNVMEIVSTETGSDQNVDIHIIITNSNEFVAFQFEILLPDAFDFVTGSAQLNLSRSVDHVLQDTLLPDRTLRIFAYSNSNTSFLGDTGVVVSFQLHSGFDPGAYLLELQDPIIGDTNSTNTLTSYINGTVTILCPDINPVPSSSDFGATPLLDSTDRQITIYNWGNQDLTIQNITFDSPYFSIIGSSSFVIPGGQNNNITVRFNSILKGNYQQIMTISSDDPDEPIVTIPLSAIAFPVNEIHTGNIFAYSGDQATLDFSINNMEPFVGFQFDLLMPSALTYIANSAVLSSRKTNHTVSANVISENVLRVVAFSNDNQAFIESDGDIVSLDFMVFGQGGFYNLNLDNALIGDTAGLNAISAHYNGQLEIAAADIHCVTSLDFGDVSVLDTGQVNLTVFNYGTDTLEITNLSVTNNSFFTSVSLPIYINPGDNTNIPVSFSQVTEGASNGTMSLFCNDPDENPKSVNLTAFAFMPNYMTVKDTSFVLGDTVFIDILVDNIESFSAFQFDLKMHGIFNCVFDSIKLSNRKADQLLQASLVDSANNKIRVFAYSLSQSNFTGVSGPLVTLPFVLDTLIEGTYDVDITDAILGNNQSENILYSFSDGQVEGIIGVPQYYTVNSDTIKNGDTICYDATNIITVAGNGQVVIVESGGHATFIAGQTIIIKHGFKSNLGSYSRAYITLTEDYCIKRAPIVSNPDETETFDKMPTLNVDNSGVTIYPNPTHGTFSIDFMDESTTAIITIINLQGIKCYEKKCEGETKVDMNIKGLKNGIYLLIIRSPNKIISKKIVKI